MNLQPTLSNHKICLQPLTVNDFEALFAVAADPFIWEQHPDKFRYQKEVFQRYFDTAIESKGAFLIIDTITNEIIGSSRYYQYDENKSEIKIGYTFITRKYWGTDYNKFIKKLMLDYAFEYLETVLFSIGEDNIRSQKATQKVGAKYLKQEGNSFIYAITKKNWQLK